MNGTNENKVDSLIAELRSFGDRPPPRFAWKRIADELESAVKEEREMLREAATEKMLEGATIIDNRGQGNAAALREALVRIHKLTNSLDEECGVDPVDILDIARSALAVPPRQCDVGTAEEQVERFKEYCQSNMQYYRDMFGTHDGAEGWDCREDCPIGKMIDKNDSLCDHCELLWAQMPDEEGVLK